LAHRAPDRAVAAAGGPRNAHADRVAHRWRTQLSVPGTSPPTGHPPTRPGTSLHTRLAREGDAERSATGCGRRAAGWRR
jgi:hypothetical protein